MYSWIHKFNEEGIAGLKPNQKGYPRKIPKKTKHIKKRAQKIELSDKEKYEEKILQQEAKLERLRIENLILKKSGCPISTLSNRRKSQIILDIRAEEPQVKLKTLFKLLNLNRKTYYDNIKNRLDKTDKYAKVKEKIKEIYYGEADETYGYRPM